MSTQSKPQILLRRSDRRQVNRLAREIADKSFSREYSLDSWVIVHNRAIDVLVTNHIDGATTIYSARGISIATPATLLDRIRDYFRKVMDDGNASERWF